MFFGVCSGTAWSQQPSFCYGTCTERLKNTVEVFLAGTSENTSGGGDTVDSNGDQDAVDKRAYGQCLKVLRWYETRWTKSALKEVEFVFQG